MADLKTSQENTLTKSGFTANTVMRLADGSTSDNYQTPVLDFINAITLTSAQAITLLGTPSDVVLDSMYKITTLSITGVDEVIISGRNMVQGNSFAQCLLHDLGIYIPCIYDVATNKINAQCSNKMFVSVDGLGGITIDSVVNNEWNGITFSATNTSGGLYIFTPSQTLQTIFTAVSMHTEQVVPQGTDIVGFASSVDDYAHDEYFLNIYDTTFGGSGTVAFPHNLITFIGYIYN